MTRCVARERHFRQRRGGHRRGAILVLAMVCVAVTMSIMTLLVRSALMHRAAHTTQKYAAQANWLVASALDLAAARLAADSSYTGEIWEIPPDKFTRREPAPDSQPAVVRIEVKPVANTPDEREIRVTADYPNSTQHRVRRSKHICVQLVPSQPHESESDDTESDRTNEPAASNPSMEKNHE